MNQVSTIVSARPAAPVLPVAHGHMIAGSDPAILQRIADDGISLALWERASPLRDGALAGFEDARVVTTGAQVAADLTARLINSESWHALLIADVAMLARHFAAIMRSASIEIRLERVTGRACWKWHSDYVTARLICTYIGPGTQWLSRGCDHPPAAGDQHQLGTGTVGLFKGKAWAGDRAIIHRSPPPDAADAERLLLVIDPVAMDDREQRL
ncbi:DUF1826 domain-containing protein [Sphingomonas sp.]|uniref:DUF1826 domain-containing protein n=1 Tax=Sphingomonas sp. TaxID=28214 RepID=UPI003D6CFF10